MLLISLRAKGAVFVKELDEIPDTSQPVIFSAHGVGKAIPAAARGRNMFVVDATCPLVLESPYGICAPLRAGTRDHSRRPSRPILKSSARSDSFPRGPSRWSNRSRTREHSCRGILRSWPTSLRRPSLWMTPPRSWRFSRSAFPELAAGQRGHLLRDDQPAKRGQGIGAPHRRIDRGRRS